jgi:GNAT superfamily N-acetyltransferase
MVEVMAVDVRPATADRWSDLVAVFGRRGEDPSWCWCRLFLRSEPAKPSASEAAPDNRAALHQEITHAEVPPGLIAYVDDHPAGWTRIGPRSAFPGVQGNKALVRVLTEDDAGVWWVTCFAVDSRYRRSGVGLALLKAAVEFARQHGATAVEGHPVDVAGLKTARVAPSALYTGTKAMFAAAGFVEVARTYPTRPVMRHSIAA